MCQNLLKHRYMINKRLHKKWLFSQLGAQKQGKRQSSILNEDIEPVVQIGWHWFSENPEKIKLLEEYENPITIRNKN